MNLTANITLDEMTTTSHEDLLVANRAEAQAHMEAINATAAMAQKVRDHFGKPIDVHSGFRGATLNKRVGGSKYSQHMKGEAIDFHIEGVPLETVWRWIVEESGLPFGQCLLEHRPGKAPTWVHLSLGEPWRPRSRSRQAFATEQA